MPPIPLRQSATNPAVCLLRALGNESCNKDTFGSGRASSESFFPFAGPRGLRYLRRRPPELNAELGQDHARLPVTHTHTQQHPTQAGLWLYYMRGCSDFMWDMGRTMLVRNRCELAVILQQRAAGNRIGWDAAVMQVARTLAEAARMELSLQLSHMRPSLESIAGPPHAVRSESLLAGAIEDCAQGMYIIKNRSTPVDSKITLVDHLLARNLLDFFSAALLAYELHDTIDTIQIANRCDEERTTADALETLFCQSPVEIWDVRSLKLDHNTQLEPMRFARGHTGTVLRRGFMHNLSRSWRQEADGSRCQMSRDWAMCLACKDSRLEQACAMRCTRGSSIQPATFLFEAEGNVNYGNTHIHTQYAEWLNQTHQHPLGKSVAWMPYWSPAIRHFRDASRRVGPSLQAAALTTRLALQ